MTNTRTLRVPLTFWDDHNYRMECPITDGPTGTEIERNKRYATVAFTEDELANYIGDLSYYAELGSTGEWRRDDDPALYNLGQAAIRNVHYINRNYEDIADEYKHCLRSRHIREARA